MNSGEEKTTILRIQHTDPSTSQHPPEPSEKITRSVRAAPQTQHHRTSQENRGNGRTENKKKIRKKKNASTREDTNSPVSMGINEHTDTHTGTRRSHKEIRYAYAAFSLQPRCWAAAWRESRRRCHAGWPRWCFPLPPRGGRRRRRPPDDELFGKQYAPGSLMRCDKARFSVLYAGFVDQ